MARPQWNYACLDILPGLKIGEDVDGSNYGRILTPTLMTFLRLRGRRGWSVLSKAAQDAIAEGSIQARISVRKSLASDLRGIELLLSSAQLPASDIERYLSTFFVADNGYQIIGVGGLENCGSGIGLLRSFVVAPEFRNQGIAARMFAQVAAAARQLGISALYLLTNTAQDYFAKRGFTRMARDDAPAPIRRTSQYANEPRCGAATLMLCQLESSLTY